MFISIPYKKATFILMLAVFCYNLAHAVKRVLFIGNSITYYNDMPQVFRDIAAQKGDTALLTVYAPGGTGFQHHSVDPNVFSHLRSGNWDIIVLQPGSSESVGVPPTQPRSTTLAQANIILDSARRYNPCARILFYEISYGVWGTGASEIAQYNNAMNEIRTTATYLADSTGLSFAPAGEALRYVWNRDPASLLWGSTGDIHPNIKGSYLVSCVFYATIFHKPSTGATIYNGNTPADAAYYQHVADSIVLKHSASWRIDTAWHRALFSYSVKKDTLQLNNRSTGQDSLRWFFDGITTTGADPNHVFKTKGPHLVRLVAYFGSCTDTATLYMNTGSVGIPVQVAADQVRIYPNPARGQLHIETPYQWGAYTLHIYDPAGRLLQTIDQPTTVDVSSMQAGTYILELQRSEDGQRSLHRIYVP